MVELVQRVSVRVCSCAPLWRVGSRRTAPYSGFPLAWRLLAPVYALLARVVGFVSRFGLKGTSRKLHDGEKSPLSVSSRASSSIPVCPKLWERGWPHEWYWVASIFDKPIATRSFVAHTIRPGVISREKSSRSRKTVSRQHYINRQPACICSGEMFWCPQHQVLSRFFLESEKRRIGPVASSQQVRDAMMCPPAVVATG